MRGVIPYCGWDKKVEKNCQYKQRSEISKYLPKKVIIHKLKKTNKQLLQLLLNRVKNACFYCPSPFTFTSCYRYHKVKKHQTTTIWFWQVEKKKLPLKPFQVVPYNWSNYSAIHVFKLLSNSSSCVLLKTNKLQSWNEKTYFLGEITASVCTYYFTIWTFWPDDYIIIRDECYFCQKDKRQEIIKIYDLAPPPCRQGREELLKNVL